MITRGMVKFLTDVRDHQYNADEAKLISLNYGRDIYAQAENEKLIKADDRKVILSTKGKSVLKAREQ